MTKPSLRSTASLILVTTALSWGLPVRADDLRESGGRESSIDTSSRSYGGNGLRLGSRTPASMGLGGSGLHASLDASAASGPQAEAGKAATPQPAAGTRLKKKDGR
ncbi:hypothetical protein N5K27_13025 [Pigmentiphaga sp. GD03639]|uniref:Uncharacterized protein n=1 Tax=Pigmentiphaga daeguensis TaxID=414049 RepID=A0ABN1CGF2_9BURK|nr:MULTISPECIES: hypothetical protein [unclassified Pigmentiphaga]MDH2237217.1 hypothetical protein [Pigmentiphaga sp. GD03639]OVZ61052.1 hypothetical protein CDO46_20415 [Pigmentiphaga sp. NML030171]